MRAPDGATPLFVAALGGSLARVEALLATPNVDATAREDGSPIALVVDDDDDTADGAIRFGCFFARDPSRARRERG